ncbi:MAG TPA: hypothetical protein VJ550_16780 [Geomonas sp.]|nr:hypothetical protein [Geomonas sp.]
MTALLPLLTGPVSAEARSCAVKEIIDSGGYTYISCGDVSGSTWIAVMQTAVAQGETVFYRDVPPMINFRTKTLNRTFPEIRFVSGISRSGDGFVEVPITSGMATSPAPEVVVIDQDQVFSGVDDTGAMVFTDDASKVPKKKAGKSVYQRENVPRNRTILDNFNKRERSVIRSLQNVLTAQCQGNLKAYRDASLPQLRPLLDSAESGELVNDLRRSCVPYFTVNEVSFGKGIPQLQLQSATARVRFETYDSLAAREGAEKTEIEAFFAASSNSWKLVNFPSRVAGRYSYKEDLPPDAKELLGH